MQKDESGMWNITVGPVEPNLYPYNSVVDGVGSPMDYLREKKLAHQSLVTEGGHTWMNARRYLAETLQLYFK